MILTWICKGFPLGSLSYQRKFNSREQSSFSFGIGPDCCAFVKRTNDVKSEISTTQERFATLVPILAASHMPEPGMTDSD